jgi:hypothetical protein
VIHGVEEVQDLCHPYLEERGGWAHLLVVQAREERTTWAPPLHLHIGENISPALLGFNNKNHQNTQQIASTKVHITTSNIRV